MDSKSKPTDSHQNVGRTVVTDVRRTDAGDKYLAAHQLEFVDAELVAQNFLRLHVPLPSLLTVDDLNNIVDMLHTLEFVYVMLSILISENVEIAKSFIALLKEQADPSKISTALLYRFADTSRIEIEPFRIVAMHYGSPGSIDFLGAGKVLELIRDTIKDLVWRGEHERQMAELERKSKQVEINKARLETEKTAVEIAAQKAELDKTRVETEKMLTELAIQRMDLIQKATTLQLSDDEKTMVFAVLLPKMVKIARAPVTPQLETERTYALVKEFKGETAK